jgi:hypothetical protein
MRDLTLSKRVLRRLAAAGILLLSACGGGGGGGDGPGTTTPPPDVFAGVSTSVAALDGWVRTDGSWNASIPPSTGDLDASVPGQTISAFYTFEIGGFAPGARIVDAALDVEVLSLTGDPHAQYGNMEARYFPYGGSLGNAVTAVVVNPPPPAVFAPNNTAPGIKRANVATLLQRAIDNGLTRLQVQVDVVGPFALNNGVDDYVQLVDGEDLIPGATVPTLRYRWTEP